MAESFLFCENDCISLIFFLTVNVLKYYCLEVIL